MEITTQTEYQGSQIARIPHQQGLYAWYYKPGVIDEQAISKTLSSFLGTTIEISTSIQMRYGVRLISTSPLNLVCGEQQETASKVLDEAIANADKFFLDFFKSNAVQIFTRPIYIGIAENLHKRVYRQHYLSLTEMWDDNHPVSRHLTAYPQATVESVMKLLSLSHTFALEARVRQIAPRDLVVHIFPTTTLPKDIGPDSDEPKQDTAARRALERLLQLVADPICGRR
jgi:hypothetical protein